MESSILLKREYGAVCLRLREMMDRRGINRNQMARRVGVRFEVVDKWYRDEVEKLDLDVLARLCFGLDCQPGELLAYRGPGGKA